MPFSPYQWATQRCARKECCRQELTRQLAAKGVSPDEVEALLDRLEAEGYLSSERYVRAFVADKFRFDRWGRVKIAAALRQKGLDEGVVQAALDECIDEEEYLEALRSLIAARERSTRADSAYALRQKVARSVIARGFEPGLVFRVLQMED